MTNPNNNNDYSQFANFDPDLLVNESDKSESLSEPSNSDGSSGNDDGATPTWNRDKLAQLVEFEADESSAKAKSAVAVKSDSPETATPSEPDNIVSRDELFEEQDDPNLSKTERTFSNSPWTKGGLVGIGAMVVFVAAGLFLNNVFNRGKVAKIPSSSTPTPTLTPTPTPTENETGKLKTEIALGTQAEQLAALNRAKSPNNPTPTITPTPGIARTPNPNIPPAQRANSPSPPPRTVYRAPANTAASPPKRVATREVVRRVRVPVQQPVPAQSTQVAGSPAPMTPKPVPATPTSPAVDPLAQWQALARLGSYGQADLNTPDSDGSSVAAIPGQQAELAMPRPTSVPTATAYSSTPAPPAAPEAIAPAKPSSIPSAEPSSIALPRAVPVIATAPTTPPPEAHAYGSAMPRRSQYTNQDNVADEESLLLNGEPPASPTAQPDLIASKEGTDSIDAEVDVLLGRSPQSPQQTPNSLPVNSPSLNGQYLQVGTNASGKLITPVLNPSSVTPTAYTNWATNPSNPNTQRFAVQLASPLPNAYGQPILKEGTLIVFIVASVAPNGWVNATAESVVFPDGREYRLPPGAIAIRGEGGNPLMAKKWDDKGPEIFSQDANAFLFGAISNVGRILNQPRSESYESNSGFGFGSSRSRINRGEPNVLGAVLEGGFSPVLASIVQRNTLAMQELRQRPNIWYVAAGKDVEVFVNQSFQF